MLLFREHVILAVALSPFCFCVSFSSSSFRCSWICKYISVRPVYALHVAFQLKHFSDSAHCFLQFMRLSISRAPLSPAVACSSKLMAYALWGVLHILHAGMLSNRISSLHCCWQMAISNISRVLERFRFFFYLFPCFTFLYWYRLFTFSKLLMRWWYFNWMNLCSARGAQGFSPDEKILELTKAFTHLTQICHVFTHLWIHL